MVATFLHFKHAHQAANVVLQLYIATTNGERIAVLDEFNLRVDATIFDKEQGGMHTEELDKRSLVTYFDVHLIMDRMQCAPFCVVDSMTIQLCGDCKMWIKDAMINATMIKQIVEYVLEKKWPFGMTNDEKLVASIMGYSMASDYQFTQANVKGCWGFAAWLVFDLTMMEHAQIVYAIEIHTQEAIFQGDLDPLRTAFEQLSREDDSVFNWRAPYAIVSILAMFDEAIYPIHSAETVVEQSGWASALLEDTLHIPRINMLVLPEMVDELPELDELFSFSPQAMLSVDDE
jgi:hypothetical protein